MEVDDGHATDRREDGPPQQNTDESGGAGAGAEEVVLSSDRGLSAASLLEPTSSLHDEDGGDAGGQGEEAEVDTEEEERREGSTRERKIGAGRMNWGTTESDEVEVVTSSSSTAGVRRDRGAGRGAPRGRGRGRGSLVRRIGAGRMNRGNPRPSEEFLYWKGDASKAFPKPEPKRRAYPLWPSWDSLVQKLYVLDWEDSAEWYVPMRSANSHGEEEWIKELLRNPLEHEARLDRIKERRKSLKSLVRYNLVQGRVARAIPAKSRLYHFPCRVRKPIDDAHVDYMGMLPFEVIYLIMSYLDPVIDLPVASCVCKLWKLIASDPLFWIPAMRRRDIMGNTVLHLAASSIDEERSLRTCGYFIQRGALVDVQNRHGATPITIATALGHQVLRLYLMRHSTTRYESYDDYRESTFPSGECSISQPGIVPYDDYMRVAKWIHSELLRLYPLPKPRTVDERQDDAPWSGLPMHRLLPKRAFAFLQPTGEPYDRRDRTLARWRASSGRSQPSPGTDSREEETRGSQSLGGERRITVDTHFSSPPSPWAPHMRRGGRSRWPSRTRPRPPPNWDDRSSFPALPGSRGGAKSRGRGRGGASATPKPIKSRPAGQGTQHQRPEVQQRAGSASTSSGMEGRISRKDKGKEKVLD